MESGVHILPLQQQQMSDVKLLSARLQTRRKMKETKRRRSRVRRSRPDQETIFGYHTDDDLLSNYSSEGSTGLK